MVSDKTYMTVAHEFAKNSYCKRAQVGALIVKDGNVVSFGYNGTPKGWDNTCEDENNTTKPEVLHAESNAIAKCASSVNSSLGADIYCTHSPCIECAKLIIQAGITTVYYDILYRSEDGIKLLQNNNIIVKQVSL
jgi:dCMP deaminase